MIKKIIEWFRKRRNEKKRKKEFQKKIDEIKKRDPFIYKH
jgi:preprotein translocase subunit YajC